MRDGDKQPSARAVSWFSILLLSGLRPRDFRALLLILFCLAFAPPRNAMVMGQNALPATCLVIISASALRLRRNRAAGVLLALALCLKPQDAAMILLFYALIGRWRAVAWSA